MRFTKKLTQRFLMAAVLPCLLATWYAMVLAGEPYKIAWEQKQWTIPDSIQIQTMDDNDQPIPNTTIKFAVIGSDFKDTLRQEVKTNQEGNAVITFSPDLKGQFFNTIFFTTEVNGLFLSYRHDWNESHAASAETIEIPEQFKVTLKKGKMVRIRVVDEEGKGIAGVQVQHEHFRKDEQSYYTDADGYYEFGPVEIEERSRVFHALFKHHDFQPLQYQEGGGWRADRVSIYPKTVTLERGKEIFGTITDEAGKPIADALVHVWGNSSVLKSETKSDESGKYHLRGLSDSEHLLIIRKTEWVLFGTQITANELNTQQNFTLKKGKTLRIKFDTTYPEDRRFFGITPPPVVTENFTFWNNNHFLFQDEKNQSQTFDVLEWNEAPNEEQEYMFVVSGFASPVTQRSSSSYRSEKLSYRFHPREEPYVIKVLDVPRITISQEEMSWPFYDDWTLPDNLRITVLDENGNPKPDAEVCLHLERGNFQISGGIFEKAFKTDKQGIVDFDFSEIDKKEVYRVFVTASAENYQQEVLKWYSDPIRGDRKTGSPLPPELNLLIYPKGKTTGLILDDDGKPIEGVKVTLGKVYHCVFDGKLCDSSSDIPKEFERTTFTDSNGKWEFNFDSGFGHGSIRVEKDDVLIPSRNYAFGTSNTDGYPLKRIITFYNKKKFAGKVVDPQGNPIQGVTFLFLNGENVKNDKEYGNLTTDENGKFSFGIATTANHNHAEVKIYSNGWTPLEQEFDLTKPTDDLTLVLTSGKDLKLQFVFEEENAPKSFLEFEVSKIIPRSKLSRLKRIGLNNIEEKFVIQPDEHGKAVLKNVPDTEVEYRFLSKNGMFVSGEYVTEQPTYQLKPKEDFQKIVIRKTSFPTRRLTGGFANGMTFSSYSSSTIFGRVEYQSSPKPANNNN
ncbi:MAG: carboxypeptidase regulatory-like domain-containing protein [Planctomycetaceae bacterium]|jgi:uncharacterized GH25 family protein|nr:carboxypeptidase regulatory-like domain-containing protein [Planctomycetaceae bacterium]